MPGRAEGGGRKLFRLRSSATPQFWSSARVSVSAAMVQMAPEIR